ncbi:MAG: ATP-binding protein [Gammaproteobacteria bacterium]|uniref:ATP-binding protein n=1 Tax=Rhodoferax sp. TaxID=50421 RepID=UPI0017D5CEEA|nr:ATP-binding protein [Rhodoferax sp.]MBU3898004.1 ATP-binding protein [Gammaproteobacteria bacterium]MBA3057095.1 ATP-binding protein [Rhodoferax sp.]MBU3995953.1 ATP-binding protein [Gammaproteobacteria bacterium]MBU4078987.1 ATP-binding protein [Gammaproteobacteria bacterium]MBU4113674.1 ATP-binding protein [Gammaproteobacteria bacterium]
MIARHATATLKSLARGYPILAITGPRQSGKTTLAQSTFPDKPYVSLEDLDTRAFADEDPRGFLARFPEGAILDEAQRCPALFSYLQTRVDKDKRMGEFVLTGSQQFGLLSNITQTLAGRVGLVQLQPFSLQELQSSGSAPGSLDDLLWRGLYPPLHDRDLAPAQWFSNYVMSYVERDVRQLIEVQNLSLFQRFLKMCAARCGQLLNLSALANDCGVTHKTVAAWLSVLEAGYVVFLLQPHHQHFGKRLVKTPKLYFHDTGLASYLMGIQDAQHLAIHSARGALFENWVISELLKRRYNQGLASNLYFWRNNTGEEVDLVLEQGEKLLPLEIKSGQTFNKDYLSGLNKWARYAGDTALPAHLVYGGDDSFTRSGVAVHSWRNIPGLLPEKGPELN